MPIVLGITLFLLSAMSGFAQRQPTNAHVNMYFPQVVDGPVAGGQWQTQFIFLNVALSVADIELILLNSDGKALAVDFGSGALATHAFRVPSGGSRTLTSTAAGSSVLSGWAVAFSTVPIHANATIRLLVDGIARQEINAAPTLPTLDYISLGRPNIGLALANPFSDVPVQVKLFMLDPDGNRIVEPQTLSLPPGGQTFLTLGERFPEIGDRTGTLILGGDRRPQDMFVAWTMKFDSSGAASGLPSGAVPYPQPHYDRIWNVYLRVVEAARRVGVIDRSPQLKIDTVRDVNAYARNGSTIGVTLGLSQLINDSDSELAAVIAHELGHIYQQRNGMRREFHSNPEFDADIWGALLALLAGYDPYGTAGALAKLSMATGRAGLASQFEDQLAADAHKSFNTRLETVYESLVAMCSVNAATRSACEEYKSIFHPGLPPQAPLRRPHPNPVSQ